MTIRVASADDVDAMADLLGEFYTAHAEALPAVFSTASKAERVRYFADALAREHEHFFVAMVEGEVVGMLSLEEVRRERLGRQPECHAMVHMVAVAEAHRRRGTGRSLLAHAREWARERGLASMRIHVWEFNDAARNLYESAGYETLSRVMGVDCG